VGNRSAESAADVVEEIRRNGGQAVACVGDLETPGVAEEVVHTALDAFGRIDIVVNNAGGGDNADGTEVPQRLFAAIGSADRDTMMRRNFATAWDVTAAAWPHLVGGGFGRIVMCSSTVSMFATAGLAHYSAAKSALLGLTRTLSVEGAAHGVTANIIVPVAASRAQGSSAEFRRWFASHFPVEHPAAAVAWLVDPDCAATGEVFAVGGSRIARTRITETRGYVNVEAMFTADLVGEHFGEVLGDDQLLELATLDDVLAYREEIHGAAPSGTHLNAIEAPDES
jgi:NAD(P)-dependent dehydrogenase (short-subunit alcohol dehydrogenase family)